MPIKAATGSLGWAGFPRESVPDAYSGRGAPTPFCGSATVVVGTPCASCSAGLGTYRWNRSFGVLILTLADGREIVACHGANDRFYVLYNHEYRPIGQILGGRSLVLDPDRLRKAVAALGGNAEPPTGSLFDRVLGAVAEALNPIGTAEARSEAAADLAAVDPMTRGSGFPPLRPPG